MSSIIFIIAYNIIKSNYISNLENELHSNAVLLEEIIKDDYINNRIDMINDKVNQLGTKLNQRITIIKKNGMVIADSDEDYRIMENHSNRPEIIDAFNNKIGKSQRYSDTLDLNMLYVAIPIKSNAQIIGVARLSIAIKDIKDIISIFKYKILFFSLIIIFAAILFAFYISKKITAPIKELTEASKKVADGDFDVRLFLNNNYEIETLAYNFNEMANKLYHAFNELKLEKEELKSIITSTNEGIIVIDNNGKILRANESFKKIFNINNEKVNDRYYWEIVRDKKIIEFIKNEKQYENNYVKEMFFQNKFILCSINYLTSKKGYVLVFYDITRLKNLENIKRDFISNVSHELRTPLTAIKGFTETLIDDEKDKEKIKYLEIIYKHTERLINIVNDLLMLSELEKTSDLNYDLRLNIEKINIYDLINNIIVMFEQKAKEKKIKISLILKNNIKFIYGDSFKLEQMFINLVDNAIKYTDKGEIDIIIERAINNMVKIEICDTGIGIPDKDIPRLFERFYVVDKSRTKKNGGTGLGLSIVKHVVILHRGLINIESKQREGTKFIIFLPKKIDS